MTPKANNPSQITTKLPEVTTKQEAPAVQTAAVVADTAAPATATGLSAISETSQPQRKYYQTILPFHFIHDIKLVLVLHKYKTIQDLIS